MSFARYPETWTPPAGRTVTARAPEVVDMLKDIIERKKKSRILIKESELTWKTSKYALSHPLPRGPPNKSL